MSTHRSRLRCAAVAFAGALAIWSMGYTQSAIATSVPTTRDAASAIRESVAVPSSDTDESEGEPDANHAQPVRADSAHS